MKPMSIVILAIGIGVLGEWSAKKPLTQKQIAGAIVVLLFFAVLDESSPTIAKPFAWLIFATTIGNYGENLFKSVGQLVGATDTKVKPSTTPKANDGTNLIDKAGHVH